MISKFIDAHVHFNTTSQEKMKLALKYDVSFLSINTNIPFFEPLERQEEVTLKLQKEYPGRINFITSFDFRKWGKPDFAKNAIEQIKEGIDRGAVGVKIWKDVGLDLRDEYGNFVMIDQPVFEPIFQYLLENDILLVGHQGEPRNCWLPLDKMTVQSDRNYFKEHPEYHMFLHNEYPTYEEQMSARDNVLKKYPDLRYVGLHLFSMEYDIDEVARRLKQFPNSFTDLAERIVHMQLQSKKNRKGVRDFCNNFQDRIIYGTDVIDDGKTNSKELVKRLESLWKFHYDFFATEKILEAPEFDGEFRGLNLSRGVVEKIFYLNAKRIYKFN